MVVHRATEHADQVIEEFILKLREHMEYPDQMITIIRLQLIEAYRQGWNDADKFFDEK